ncbi:MAG: 3-hydroxyacyl-ACP dehydratase FabZ [Rhodobiaceae bacterium]|nr:3-hydroxyacyl-ACP dehydratase FabZ [Rhodobiaceae bacterium]
MAAEEGQTLGTADLERIMQVLPHRYPFLMVDRIVEMDGDRSCVGIKNVTANEPHFQGHFPGEPIMPGVLLVEGMAQTAGALCIMASSDGAPSLVYFMTIDKCRFRKPVRPGDQVKFHMTKIRSRGTIWKFQGYARVDGAVVAEAEVSAMMVLSEKTS